MEGAPDQKAFAEALKVSTNVTNLKEYEQPNPERPNDVDAQTSVMEADIDGHHVVVRQHPPVNFKSDPITWSGEIDGVPIEEGEAADFMDKLEGRKA